MAIFSSWSRPNQTLGQQAEKRAERFLIAEGLIFKDRNYCGPRGEIDLIMYDRETLVFIEVRLRQNPKFTSASESVTQQKQTKIIRTAHHYLQKNNLWDKIPCRFDVLAWSTNHVQAEPEWIKNAFYAQ